MAKQTPKVFSQLTRHAAELLGQLIQIKRKERGLTSQELATRAGISRSLLQRIEKGDLSCSIGAVFEAASICGVELFEADGNKLKTHLSRSQEKLSLLPNSVRKKVKAVKDDF
jgi:transcriptional regulator with XRE-family HTH domain